MSIDEPHTIWTAQCAATASIRARYGLTAAFEYLVVEKLMNFAEAARRYPEFAQELPRFVAEVRCIFTPSELQEQFAEAGCRTASEFEAMADQTPAARKERADLVTIIEQLLGADRLGTS